MVSEDKEDKNSEPVAVGVNTQKAIGGTGAHITMPIAVRPVKAGTAPNGQFKVTIYPNPVTKPTKAAVKAS